MAEKNRHLSRDREYLQSQLARGFEVVVDGKLYNRSTANQMPSQEELDGDLKPAAGLRGRVQTPTEKSAAEKTKAQAEKAAADNAESDRVAAEKAEAERAEAEKKAAAAKGGGK